MAVLKESATCRASQSEVDDLVLDLLPLQGQWSEEAYLVSVDAVFDAD